MADDKTPDLAEIDPIFAAPIGMQKAITTPKKDSATTAPGPGPVKNVVDPGTAGLLGAGVGMLAPKMEVGSTTSGLTQAKANLAGTKAASTTAQQEFLKQAGAYDTRLTDLQKSLAAAQATHSENMAAYQLARQKIGRAHV